MLECECHTPLYLKWSKRPYKRCSVLLFLLLSHYQLTIAIVNGRSDYLLEQAVMHTFNCLPISCLLISPLPYALSFSCYYIHTYLLLRLVHTQINFDALLVFPNRLRSDLCPVSCGLGKKCIFQTCIMSSCYNQICITDYGFLTQLGNLLNVKRQRINFLFKILLYNN